MSTGRDLVVSLRCVEELFEPPEEQPFDPATRFERGIDEILDRLGDREHRDTARVVVELPPAQIHDSTTATTRAAIGRYGSYRSARCRKDLHSSRVRGLRALRTGLVILFVALALSTLIDEVDWLPDFLQRFFSEGIAIIGWVTLWNPVDALLFAPIPIARERRRLERLARCDIDVVAHVGG